MCYQILIELNSLHQIALAQCLISTLTPQLAICLLGYGMAWLGIDAPDVTRKHNQNSKSPAYKHGFCHAITYSAHSTHLKQELNNGLALQHADLLFMHIFVAKTRYSGADQSINDSL